VLDDDARFQIFVIHAGHMLAPCCWVER